MDLSFVVSEAERRKEIEEEVNFEVDTFQFSQLVELGDCLNEVANKEMTIEVKDLYELTWWCCYLFWFF